ncbi:MAG TPA: DUF3500 domain-containing protein [Bryobacteraceae bacterium]|jgi:uncharacterized protein (TIGR03437 family)|nr:DUF3500 domain-containing protein [Bryobacteraceae bacterium]
MKSNQFVIPKRSLQALQHSGGRFLVPMLALLSLGVATNFLIGLRAADTRTDPAITAGNALNRRLLAASSRDVQANVNDVVTSALAFEALLTTAQQGVLQQAYTPTLAEKWSNLPCANTCRNGIGLGTLTSTQLTAALAVIQAATSAATNEGLDKFQQIRMADDVLAAAQGSGGGGSGGGGGPGGAAGGYGSGNYYLSFLNAPSTTGAWMLQFGGHHYAANISFNEGHVVSTTPYFYGLEPLTFTTNNTTYTPLVLEHDAMTAMLASFSDTQLAAAKLSQTFSDCTMIPGETEGGTGTFPSTKVGIAVSTLSSAQQQLVMAAMQPWIQNMTATVAANLLATYQNELSGTYVAWTGSGTSGNASSFLNTNTNYVRIDGPSVWIEFICQNGVVFANQIHYHSVWRDHQRDYAKDLSLTVPLDSTTSTAGAAVVTSAASYAAGSLAPEAIGTLFGTALASSAASASTTPLPTSLGNVQVQVTDSSGVSRPAPLFYVSPTQISFQNPAGTTTGSATVTVTNGSALSQGAFTIQNVSPGLFAANANGQGVAAAMAVLAKADGSQVTEAVLQLNSSTNQYEAVPLTVASGSDQLYLILFGTGFRNRSSLANVSVTVGSASAQVTYAGAQGSYTGLDQANIVIPSSLAGSGNVNVVLTVDGVSSNPVSINIK